jgi:hypothetical protein
MELKNDLGWKQEAYRNMPDGVNLSCPRREPLGMMVNTVGTAANNTSAGTRDFGISSLLVVVYRANKAPKPKPQDHEPCD